MPASGDRQTDHRRLGVAVGGTGVAFVAVALAATGGPVPLAEERSNGWSLRLPPVDGERAQPEGAEPVDVEPVQPDSIASDAVEVLGQVVVLLVVATIVYLVARAAFRAVRLSSEARLVAVPADEAPPTGSRAVADAVDEGLEALAGGPVDDVVVACWVRLEEAAAAAGAGRRPSETAAELAVRVLESFDAPPGAVQQLLDLYRAARYSQHPLGERDRATAIAALDDIRRAVRLVPT